MKQPPLVWIIDDDAGILEVMQIILEEKGYSFEVFNNTPSFLAALTHNKPQVILLDAYIGTEDGRQICRTLKEDPKTKQIPIIIFSADNTVSQKAQDARADGYLAKPFDIETLTGMLQKYLSP